MKKIAMAAAFPLALALSACGADRTDDAAQGDATAATASQDDALATDTSAVGPTDTTPRATPAGSATAGLTPEQRAEVADETAEDLEERADAVEDVNEAEADRLEAEAKRLQRERDANR